ncbi:MAG: hypothetical protein MJZ49_02435 [Bacteroidales bacterium]|nr:hypothetical protein [Bacteroidales bacterium]
MACSKNHKGIQVIMSKLPIDQGGIGRHKCAACAYEEGFRLGLNGEDDFNIHEIINDLEESQAQNQRHKSPHAAFARGYFDGINEYYRTH